MVKRKLVEMFPEYGIDEPDNVLCEHVQMLLCNRKQRSQVIADLTPFLEDGAPQFIKWLWDYLRFLADSFEERPQLSGGRSKSVARDIDLIHDKQKQEMEVDEEYQAPSHQVQSSSRWSTARGERHQRRVSPHVIDCDDEDDDSNSDPGPRRGRRGRCRVAGHMHGSAKGLVQEEEYDTKVFEDKERKVAFLERVILLVNRLLGVTLAVRASKTTSGSEPENTNEFLTTFLALHGSAKGLVQEEEYDTKVFEDKERKVAFLERVILLVNRLLGVTLAVRASKTTSGSEPENTNEFLQALVRAVETFLAQHGSAKGLVQEEEYDTKVFEDKERKVAFLERVILLVNRLLGVTLAVRA
eukprot:EG_transcript_16599